MRFSRSSWAIAAVAAFGLSALTLPPAKAEDVKSADTLVKGLAPVKTRGFDPTAPGREAKQQELNTKLREFKTRQITVEERTEVVEAHRRVEIAECRCADPVRLRLRRHPSRGETIAR